MNDIGQVKRVLANIGYNEYQLKLIDDSPTLLRLIDSYSGEYRKAIGGVLKCMLINGGQTKSNEDTVYLRCGSSKYHLLSPLPWAEYKAKRQIRQ